jgi:hypothetical protein
MCNFGCNPIEGARRAGKIGSMINDRDQRSGCVIILNILLF